jgi:hypothetical protein
LFYAYHSFVNKYLEALEKALGLKIGLGCYETLDLIYWIESNQVIEVWIGIGSAHSKLGSDQWGGPDPDPFVGLAVVASSPTICRSLCRAAVDDAGRELCPVRIYTYTRPAGVVWGGALLAGFGSLAVYCLSMHVQNA